METPIGLGTIRVALVSQWIIIASDGSGRRVDAWQYDGSRFVVE
jgi:hypothetical protein